MLVVRNRRRHVDDPLNELCFAKIWRGIVASLEFSPSQMIAGLQRRNTIRWTRARIWTCNGRHYLHKMLARRTEFAK